MRGKILSLDQDSERIAAAQEEWDFHQITICQETNIHDVIFLLREKDSFDLIIIMADYYKSSLYDIVRTIREVTPIPILVFTTNYDVNEKVCTLQLGADEYTQMTNPFQMDDGIASCLALIRRYRTNNCLFSKSEDAVNLCDFIMHRNMHKLYYNGDMIPLTVTEYTIFDYLLSNVGRILTYEQIIGHTWKDNDYMIDKNALQMHIKRLRQKLLEKTCGALIKSERGVGYYIEACVA